MIDFVAGQQQTAANALFSLSANSGSAKSALPEPNSGFSNALKSQLDSAPEETPVLKDESGKEEEMAAMAAYASAVSAQNAAAQNRNTSEETNAHMDVAPVHDASVLNMADMDVNAEPIPETPVVPGAEALAEEFLLMDPTADAEVGGTQNPAGPLGTDLPAESDNAADQPKQTLPLVAETTESAPVAPGTTPQSHELKTPDVQNTRPVTVPVTEAVSTESVQTAAPQVTQAAAAAAPVKADPAAATQETEPLLPEDVQEDLLSVKTESAPKEPSRSRLDGHAHYMQWRMRQADSAEPARQMAVVDAEPLTEEPPLPKTDVPVTLEEHAPVEEKNTKAVADTHRHEQTASLAAKSEAIESGEPVPEKAEATRFAQEARDVQRQLLNAARLNRPDGTTRLEIQLQPQHLGKITLSLAAAENGMITAQLRTANEQVSAMLRSQLGELELSLKNMGINMDNIEVSEGSNGWDFTNSREGRQNFGGQSGRRTPQKSGNRIDAQDVFMSAALRSPYGTAVQNAYLPEEVSVEYLA